MSKERYVEHTVDLELPIRDSVTKGNYNLADIEIKYLSIQTEVVSDNKDKTITDLEAKLAESEEQLAKKEKELAYMTEQAKKFNNEAQKYFEDAYCNDFHNQDKISFAIEELEKVKEFVNDIYGEYSASVITNFIDKQIKSLK